MFEPDALTEVQQLHVPIFAEKGIEVFLKREDRIHPFISGNKWRKLKYVLADAKQQEKSTLVSFGGAYSNHLVALACAGAENGFKTKAFVRGEDVSNVMLSLCRTWGMKLEFVSREAYRDKKGLFATVPDNERCYFIDEGGKGALAARGCSEILDGIENFSHVICAVGTGTTFAGLVNAASRKQMKADGICVLKGAAAIEQDIRMLVSGDNWTVHHEFHEGGYAKTSPALFSFIDDFAARTGILFDQVYTAKMMRAVILLAERGYYHKGDRLLLIHTGGLLGLMSRWQ